MWGHRCFYELINSQMLIKCLLSTNGEEAKNIPSYGAYRWEDKIGSVLAWIASLTRLRQRFRCRFIWGAKIQGSGVGDALEWKKQKEGRVCHWTGLSPSGNLLRNHLECTLGLLPQTPTGCPLGVIGCSTCCSLICSSTFWNGSAGPWNRPTKWW